MTCFGVITEINNEDVCDNHAVSLLLINPKRFGNMAGSHFIVDPNSDDKLSVDSIVNEGSIIDMTKKQTVLCLTPVFRLGEIMVMGSNDRTIPDGRKPSKWFVTCEYFDDIESAINRAKEVTK